MSLQLRCSTSFQNYDDVNYQFRGGEVHQRRRMLAFLQQLRWFSHFRFGDWENAIFLFLLLLLRLRVGVWRCLAFRLNWKSQSGQSVVCWVNLRLLWCWCVCVLTPANWREVVVVKHAISCDFKADNRAFHERQYMTFTEFQFSVSDWGSIWLEYSNETSIWTFTSAQGRDPH